MTTMVIINGVADIPFEVLALAVGDLCVGVRCKDETFLDDLARRCRSFVTEGDPHSWLTLSLRTDLSVEEINELLPRLQARRENGFVITEPRLFECCVDWMARRVQVATERHLFSHDVKYRFMNVLARCAI